jgi:hypothetical protein
MTGWKFNWGKWADNIDLHVRPGNDHLLLKPERLALLCYFYNIFPASTSLPSPRGTCRSHPVSAPASPPLRKHRSRSECLAVSAVLRTLPHFPHTTTQLLLSNTSKILTLSLQLSTWCALFGLGGLPWLLRCFGAPFLGRGTKSRAGKPPADDRTISTQLMMRTEWELLQIHWAVWCTHRNLNFLVLKLFLFFTA